VVKKQAKTGDERCKASCLSIKDLCLRAATSTTGATFRCGIGHAFLIDPRLTITGLIATGQRRYWPNPTGDEARRQGSPGVIPPLCKPLAFSTAACQSDLKSTPTAREHAWFRAGFLPVHARGRSIHAEYDPTR
jgi:hypothetical protein